jgi:hypothetical protein
MLEVGRKHPALKALAERLGKDGVGGWIKVMRIDHQAEHRLRIFACLYNVGWTMVPEVLHMFEPTLYVMSQGVSEYAGGAITAFITVVARPH